MNTTDRELEAMEARVATELKARKIPKEVIGEALTFIGEFLPTISDYDRSTQLAVYGIACYYAGYQRGASA